MPWKECPMVDERLRFAARLLDGEEMTTVCAAFGISRKTAAQMARLRIQVARARAWSPSPSPRAKGTTSRLEACKRRSVASRVEP
jgi:hypothetical protein